MALSTAFGTNEEITANSCSFPRRDRTQSSGGYPRGPEAVKSGNHVPGEVAVGKLPSSRLGPRLAPEKAGGPLPLMKETHGPGFSGHAGTRRTRSTCVLQEKAPSALRTVERPPSAMISATAFSNTPGSKARTSARLGAVGKYGIDLSAPGNSPHVHREARAVIGHLLQPDDELRHLPGMALALCRPRPNAPPPLDAKPKFSPSAP